jgi:hypothetical protein
LSSTPLRGTIIPSPPGIRQSWAAAHTRLFHLVRRLGITVEEVDLHRNPKTASDWIQPETQKTVLTLGKN